MTYCKSKSKTTEGKEGMNMTPPLEAICVAADDDNDDDNDEQRCVSSFDLIKAKDVGRCIVLVGSFVLNAIWGAH